ncbi:flavoprotein [Kineosporia babensis]|uniref:Flavoprotein n=1 Tax=Kineosporia babensis TaxID=499548 RepID=A0A9X1NKT2_9ACTN|nr:flavoprotein [Kineosporia babensis]MCD5316837.1 flavoprotein [Kineosporia babensis]
MSNRVLYLIVCAAPPARSITELIDLLHADSWNVHVIATPSAMEWIPVSTVEAQTGHPVSHRPRRPDEARSLPKADAVVVAPATFNTINQWANGTNDTLALGILNEVLGIRLPVIATVYAKPSLTSHPAFATHIGLLTGAGVIFTETESLRPTDPSHPFEWRTVTELLASFADPGAREH